MNALDALGLSYGDDDDDDDDDDDEDDDDDDPQSHLRTYNDPPSTSKPARHISYVVSVVGFSSEI